MTTVEILVSIAGTLFIAGFIGVLYLIDRVDIKDDSWEDNFKSIHKK